MSLARIQNSTNSTADITARLIRAKTGIPLPLDSEILKRGAHACLQNGIITTTTTPDLKTLSEEQVELQKETHSLKMRNAASLKTVADKIFKAETVEKDCQDTALILDQKKEDIDAERFQSLTQLFKETNIKDASGRLDTPRVRALLEAQTKNNLKIKKDLVELEQKTREAILDTQTARREVRAALGLASTSTPLAPSFRN